MVKILNDVSMTRSSFSNSKNFLEFENDEWVIETSFKIFIVDFYS